MELLEILGYISSLVIGISLGLIGGGGSILTVPVLVYLMGVEPVLATSYSLLIVGVTALVGAIQNMIKKQVSIKTAVVFAIPSFIAVFLTRLYVMPAIPDSIVNLGNFELTKPIAVMVFFAIIMLLAAYSMISNGKKNTEEKSTQLKFNYPMIIIEGLVVGVLTGLVGAGGGFLIIPALVLLAKLPMKLAVGTSLLIIAVKSIIGFGGDIAASQNIDWIFLLIISALAVIGIFIGTWISNYISGAKLKKGFGYFVLVMAAFIISKELFLK